MANKKTDKQDELREVIVNLDDDNDEPKLGLIDGKKKSQSKAFDSSPKCNKNAVFAVIFYWVTSLSLVFLNKTIMAGDITGLDAPLFMSWTQFLVTVIICYLLGKIGSKIKIFSFFPAFEYKMDIAKKVMPLTCVFLLMIIFNNLCLKYVEVSFYHVKFENILYIVIIILINILY